MFCFNFSHFPFASSLITFGHDPAKEPLHGCSTCKKPDALENVVSDTNWVEGVKREECHGWNGLICILHDFYNINVTDIRNISVFPLFLYILDFNLVSVKISTSLVLLISWLKAIYLLLRKCVVVFQGWKFSIFKR